MKTITQDGITYIYRYVKAHGRSWTYGYYPDTGKVETKKKSPRKTQEDKCDDLWRKIIYKNYGYKCAVCGKANQLNAHHIVTRSNKNLRWDVKNGIALCPDHHTLSAKLSAHKTPNEFREWLNANYPNNVNYLDLRKMEKSQKQDMKLIYIYLQKEAKKEAKNE